MKTKVKKNKIVGFEIVYCEHGHYDVRVIRKNIEEPGKWYRVSSRSIVNNAFFWLSLNRKNKTTVHTFVYPSMKITIGRG